MVLESKKLALVVDLCLDLQLYNLPESFTRRLKAEFPNIDLYFVNCSKESLDVPFEEVEIFFGNRIDQKIYNKFPNLKWIHFGSAGVDRLLNMKIDPNIIITNSGGIMSRSVSVHALSFVLFFARGLFQVKDNFSSSIISRKDFDNSFNYVSDLNGLKVCVFGRGKSGQFLISLLKEFGCKLLNLGRNDLDSLSDKKLSDYDYIINILPLDRTTNSFFDKSFFKLLSKDAIFINVGRGETVCERDLIDALCNGSIRGAGLDVFENEPIDNKHPFASLSNVICTPHVAGLFNNYWREQEELFFHNLSYFLGKIDSGYINRV